MEVCKMAPSRDALEIDFKKLIGEPCKTGRVSRNYPLNFVRSILMAYSLVRFPDFSPALFNYVITASATVSRLINVNATRG